MSDFIRKEKFLGGEKIIVGDKRTELILESLGKVYIKSGNSSRSLNEVISAVDKLSTNDTSSIIALTGTQTITNIEYPGDNKFIYTGDVLYLTLGGDYIPLIDMRESGSYVQKIGDTMTGQLTIQLEDLTVAPMSTNSSVLVKNLNAEYVGGKTLENYTNKVVDESISGKWKFNTLASKNISTDTITSSNGFSSGLSGYGWQIDSNTLTIDNVIIRKTLQLLENANDVYLSKINGTNCNLWVNSPTTVIKVEYIEIVESSILEKVTSLGTRNVYFGGTYNGDSIELCAGYDQTGSSIVEVTTKLALDSTTNSLYNFYDYFQGDFYMINFSGNAPKVNDILRCQSISDSKKRYYDCIVTNSLDNSFVIVRCSETINDLYFKNGQKTKNPFSENISEEESEESENYVETPNIGDTLVLIANIENGYSGIYLSTIEAQSPAVVVIENSTTPDYQIQNTLNSKLGNLDGVSDSDMEINGVGFYTKNLNARTKNWIISNGVIKYTGGNGIVLNDSGLLDTVTPSTSPFSARVESYIRNTILSDLVTSVSDLKSEIATLKSEITSLKDRVSALEGTR